MIFGFYKNKYNNFWFSTGYFGSIAGIKGLCCTLYKIMRKVLWSIKHSAC